MEVLVLALELILRMFNLIVIGSGVTSIHVVAHYQIELKLSSSNSRFNTATKLAYSYAACASCDKRLSETDCGRNAKCAWNTL